MSDLPGYDAWKLRAPGDGPYDEPDEPEEDEEIEPDEDYDPTPWCSGCGARKQSDCHCGPIAEND
jgi:hypothetical protein